MDSSPASTRNSSKQLPFTEIDEQGTVSERFERVAAFFPEKLAVKEFHRAFTYRQLNQSANRLGRAILDRLGEKPEPVVLLFTQRIDTVPALLAVVKTGKYYAVLSPTDPPARLQATLANLNPRLVLVDSGSMEAAAAAIPSGCSLLNIGDVDPETPCENLGVHLTPDMTFAIFLTSGSTGVPKGILREHLSTLARLRWDAQSTKLCAEDHIAHLNHFGFGVSQGDLFNALLMGGSLHIYNAQKLGVAPLADWLRSEKITILHPPIAFFRVFLSTLVPSDFFPDMRLLRLGGDVLYRKDVESARPHFSENCRFIHRYSSSEASTVCEFDIDRSTTYEGGVVPVGYVLAGKELLILDENHHPVPAGESGEIAVRSRLLSSGYFNQPELTGEKFIPDPENPGQRIYLSGDLGRQLPDGCLQFLGRKDFMVKVRGYRVELSAIESALLDLPSVKNAAATVFAAEGGEKQIAAFVVPAVQPAPSTAEIRRSLAVTLPDFMLPSVIVFLDALPLTPTGKVDRKALPLPVPQAPSTPAGQVSPAATPQQASVGALWQELLGRVPSPGDDFFDLGGNSLLAMRMLNQVEKQFGLRLSPADLLQAPTLAAFAALLPQQKPARAAPSDHTLVPIQVPAGPTAKPNLFFVHGLGGGVSGYAEVSRLLGSDQPVYGLQAAGVVGECTPDTSMQAMADRYIVAMRSIQPHGPYYISGYCLGGVVAFEVARQLILQGDTVALLALIETYVPLLARRPTPLTLHSLACFTSNLGVWTSDLVTGADPTILPGVGRKIGLLGKRLLRRAGFHVEILPEDRLGDDARHVTPEVRRVITAHNRALHQYQPGPYPAKITLLRSRRLSLMRGGDPLMGWTTLAQGGLDLRVIPGSHHDVMLSPQVQGLAQVMQKLLP